MAKVVIEKVEDLKDWVGKEVGVSDWLEVTQEQVNDFADVTGDHNWIHVDPERARRESPYGQAIAHGYFTLSLAPMLRAGIVDVTDKKTTINYGLDKLRFPAALPVGKRLRMRATLSEVREIKGGLDTFWDLVFEVEDQERPACAARAIYRYLEAD